MRRGLVAFVAVVAIGCLALPVSPSEAKLRFGVAIVNEPLNEVDMFRMRTAGGRVIRTSLLWSRVQRRQDGRYDWSRYDGMVERAARARISIVPRMIGSPIYAADRAAEPPMSGADRRGFARFLSAAVRRYGRNGSFWRLRPHVPYRPIGTWQVWNEPNLASYWTDGDPSPREYASLLRLSARAIRNPDPRAEVELAGMPEVSGRGRMGASEFLDRLYRIRGVKRLFDVVALHPYGATVAEVDRNITKTRRVMRRHGDGRTPISITELGWGSDGKAGHELVKGRAGQARLLERSFRLLRKRSRRYRLHDVIWFRWQDQPGRCTHSTFCWVHHAGLFKGDGQPKPAFRAFARQAGGNPLTGPLPPDLIDRLRP